MVYHTLPVLSSIGRLTGNKHIEILWRFLWKHFIQCWRNAFKDISQCHGLYRSLSVRTGFCPVSVSRPLGFLQPGMEHTFNSVTGTLIVHVQETRCYFHQIVSSLGYEARICIILYQEMLHGRGFAVSEIGNR